MDKRTLPKTEDHKRKISESNKGKHQHLFGRVFSDEHKNKIGEANTGVKHAGWKGDKVTYSALHKWVRYHKGSAAECSQCGVKKDTGKKIEWSNIDHNYSRNLEDYISLCVPCHKAYDRDELGVAMGCKANYT